MRGGPSSGPARDAHPLGGRQGGVPNSFFALLDDARRLHRGSGVNTTAITWSCRESPPSHLRRPSSARITGVVAGKRININQTSICGRSIPGGPRSSSHLCRLRSLGSPWRRRRRAGRGFAAVSKQAESGRADLFGLQLHGGAVRYRTSGPLYRVAFSFAPPASRSKECLRHSSPRALNHKHHQTPTSTNEHHDIRKASHNATSPVSLFFDSWTKNRGQRLRHPDLICGVAPYLPENLIKRVVSPRPSWRRNPPRFVP